MKKSKRQSVAGKKDERNRSALARAAGRRLVAYSISQELYELICQVAEHLGTTQLEAFEQLGRAGARVLLRRAPKKP